MSRLDGSFSLRGLFSGEKRKPTLILLWTPFALITWRYYGASVFFAGDPAGRVGFVRYHEQATELYSFLSTFILLGLVSLAIVTLVFKEPLASYGLALGDWRFGIKALAVTAPVIVLLSALAARTPAFQAQYPLFRGACASASSFLVHATAYFAYYIGFEVFFRGLVQFGLRETLGDSYAILVQTALSCLVHIGKPSGEIYGAIVGGLAFGFVAFRSRSLLYVVLAHWVLGVSLDLFICLG